MKWPLAAACTRAGIADALATITPAIITPGRGRPPPAVLRTALYGHAFNPARASADPGPSATALAWARDHSLPVTALADPAVTRRAVEALALDGSRAAVTTITRKRAVFHNCLSYAVELRMLEANPVDRITWRPPRPSCPVNPRSAASPAEVQAILAEITKIRPELTAFFGCLYYAALRPAEAVALRADSCDLLPARLGAADTHWIPPPLGACLDRQRHATRGPRPETPPRRRYPDSPHPAAACPPPPPSPARLRVRCRRAAVQRCPRRPTQRKPLRPDLASGPRRRHPRPGRHTTGTPPLRPASRRAVAVAGLRRPARRSRGPRRAQHACPAHLLRARHTRLRPDRQPADRASPQPQPVAPRWPTRIHVNAGNPVRYMSVPQLDSAGHNWTRHHRLTTDETFLTCENADRETGSTDHGPGPPIPGA